MKLPTSEPSRALACHSHLQARPSVRRHVRPPVFETSDPSDTIGQAELQELLRLFRALLRVPGSSVSGLKHG